MPNPTKKGNPIARRTKFLLSLVKVKPKNKGAKRHYYLKYRSAKTGRFVTKEYALKHLKTTVSEKVYL